MEPGFPGLFPVFLFLVFGLFAGGRIVVTVPPPVAGRSARNGADTAQNQREAESREKPFHRTPLISTFLARAPESEILYERASLRCRYLLGTNLKDSEKGVAGTEPKGGLSAESALVSAEAGGTIAPGQASKFAKKARF